MSRAIGHLSASTLCSPSSIPHISSIVACPIASPRRFTSTAPTCSTNTRVVAPFSAISGRNDAPRALRDVGALRTTDLVKSASAWTTNPHRRPAAPLRFPGAFGARRSHSGARKLSVNDATSSISSQSSTSASTTATSIRKAPFQPTAATTSTAFGQTPDPVNCVPSNNSNARGASLINRRKLHEPSRNVHPDL